MTLAELVADSGMTYEQLAQEIKVSASTISRVITGKGKRPHPKTKKLIADYFQVAITDIDEFKKVNSSKNVPNVNS